jgi:hypothetical protein
VAPDDTPTSPLITLDAPARTIAFLISKSPGYHHSKDTFAYLLARMREG